LFSKLKSFRYGEVFGFRKIRSDVTTDRAETPNGPIFKIYPNLLNKVKIAWLSCGNGVGFEVFEFQDPAYKKARDFDSEFHHGGFFHIAITVPDPGMLYCLVSIDILLNIEDATAKKVTELGGKRVGKTTGIYGEKALYVQDPWGNVIECMSCSFEQFMGDKASLLPQ
jgi:hypothetical protein